MSRRAAMLARVAAVAALTLIVMGPLFLALAIACPSLWSDGEAPRLGPGDWGVEYESFNVTTKDEVRLAGWLLRPAGGPGSAVFIVMHGYGGSKRDPEVLRVAVGLARRGYYVAVFDFRGHGDSGGYSTLGPREVLDAEAVVGWVSERLPGKPVYLLGFDLGGVVAIVEGARDPRVKGVIADNPFYTLGEKLYSLISTPVPGYQHIIAGLWSILTGAPADFTPASVGRVGKPYLVIYSFNNPAVSVDEARRIAHLGYCCPNNNCLAVLGGPGGLLGNPSLDTYLDLVESVVWSCA